MNTNRVGNTAFEVLPTSPNHQYGDSMHEAMEFEDDDALSLNSATDLDDQYTNPNDPGGGDPG